MENEQESAFLALVAHELRTPITVIVGLAATLAARRRELTEEQIDESLARIQAQGGQLSHLVEDLLDLAQVEAGRFHATVEPVQVVGAGARAVADAPPPSGRSVEMTVADDVWVAADPARLDQVLVNLLTNAYRYGGSHVWLEALRTPAGVVVTVSDDGAGVPDELVGRLFDKFARQTSDGHGTGLGLSIVRGLVEAFGGRVWYEPREPAGARFALQLNEADAALDNPAVTSKRRGGSRV